MAYIFTCPEKSVGEENCRASYSTIVKLGYNGSYAQFSAQCCSFPEEDTEEEKEENGVTPPDIPPAPLPGPSEDVLGVAEAQAWIGQVIDGIMEGIGNISGSIGGWAEDAIGGIGKTLDAITDLGGTIVGGITQAVEGIGGVIKRAIDKIKEWLDSILNWIMDRINDVIRSVGDLIEKVLLVLQDVVGGVITAVGGFIESVIKWATEELDKLWVAIEAGFQSFVDWLAETVDDIITAIGDFFDRTIKGIQDSIVATGKWFDEAIREIGTWIEEIAVSVGEAISFGFQDMIEFFTRTFDDLKRDLTSFGDIDSTQFENLIIWMAKIQLKASAKIAKAILADEDMQPGGVPEQFKYSEGVL